jgi:hypothetical protein
VNAPDFQAASFDRSSQSMRIGQIVPTGQKFDAFGPDAFRQNQVDFQDSTRWAVNDHQTGWA